LFSILGSEIACLYLQGETMRKTRAVKKNGFTLIEMVIVLAMLGVLGAVSFAYSMRQQSRWDLRGTAREISSTIHNLKQSASRQNLMHRVEFENENIMHAYARGETAGDWQHLLRVETLGKVSFAEQPVDFLINSRGMILCPLNLQPVSRTITLRSPKGAGYDNIFIRVLPHGGVQIERHFN